MDQNLFPSRPVFIIDDQECALDDLEMALFSRGINHIRLCRNSSSAVELTAQLQPALILLNPIIPHIGEEELLVQLRSAYPAIPVVMITSYNDAEKAVACIRQGACDYLVKPVEADRLAAIIRRIIESEELRWENSCLKKQLFGMRLEYPDAFSEILTTSEEMLAIFRYIEMVARSSQCVLVTGETGTGKELIVHTIHRLSGRAGNLVTVNIAGLDEGLFNDTLFGHAPGAFTGADSGRNGLIEKASGGTLFLDEIGDLSPGSQLKLLRLLQEQEYFPLGVDEASLSTARLIAATNKDIKILEDEKHFRKDLFYRLQRHHIHLPPLRQRPVDDLALLVPHFLKKAADSLGKPVPTVSKHLIDLLANYDFPGNIRELEYIIGDAVTRHQGGVLSLDSLKNHIAAKEGSGPILPTPGEASNIIFPRKLPTLKACSHLLVQEALRRAGNNQSLAARMLGISTQALNQRLKRMGKTDQIS